MSLQELLQHRDDIEEQDIPTILQRVEQLQKRAQTAYPEDPDSEDEEDQIEFFVETAIQELHRQKSQSTEEASEGKDKQDSEKKEAKAGNLHFTEVPELAFWQRPLSNKEVVLYLTGIGLVAFFIWRGLEVFMEEAPSMEFVEEKTGVGLEDAVAINSTSAADIDALTISDEEDLDEEELIQELFDTGLAAEEDELEIPQRSQHLLDIEAELQGEWILVSSYFWDKGRYNITAESKRYSEREYLHFESGEYSRVMDKGLFFSGGFIAQDPVPLPKPIAILPEGTVFLLHSTDVSSSISGFKKTHDYYHAELQEDNLVLFYLGTRLSSFEHPIRGHQYKRKGKVYRRR